MRYAAAFLGVLLCCLSAHAAEDRQTPSAPRQAGGIFRTTDHGAFRLEMLLGGGKLALGPNSLDLKVRDRAGLAVEGADIVITPWMPGMGHGVWDKPVVTERGGGEYHVDNIKIIMGGRWDLRVAVRKGGLAERTLFPFEVTGSGGGEPRTEAAKREEGYERNVTHYNVPNVTLLNQDGETVGLKSLTDSGKPVVMDFIFTTCTTICPVLSAGLANLRSELGDGASRVQVVSITMDPEHDRPERLKEYGARFNAGVGWTFLTGSREDVGSVLKAFDAFVVDKMSHEPLYFLRGPNSDEWVRIKGLVGENDLMNEFRRIENK